MQILFFTSKNVNMKYFLHIILKLFSIFYADFARELYSDLYLQGLDAAPEALTFR